MHWLNGIWDRMRRRSRAMITETEFLALPDRQKDEFTAKALGWQTRWTERTRRGFKLGSYELWVKPPDATTWRKGPHFHSDIGLLFYYVIGPVRGQGIFIDILPCVGGYRTSACQDEREIGYSKNERVQFAVMVAALIALGEVCKDE